MQRRMVSAAIGTVFVHDSADAARAQWRSVADQLQGKFPKLGTLMGRRQERRARVHDLPTCALDSNLFERRVDHATGRRH